MTEQTTKGSSPGPDRSGGAASRRAGFRALLSMLVLALGVIAIALLIQSRKPPGRREQKVLAPLVQVRKLVTGDIQMVVRGHGTIRPKVEVEIIPEVAGKVVFIHSELKAGGIIRANEKIVQIDSRDYELGVRQARAAVAEAQAGLDAEVADADVERRQWRQLHPETEAELPLASREPRIHRARAALDSAKTQLELAELKLERTTISLPFDAMIAGDVVDLGQYVGIGQRLATACGIDAFEVEVLLERDDLAWFDAFPLPAPTGGTEGNLASADVQARLAGETHTWAGHVTRATGQVDLASQRVPVVVEIPRPLEASAGRPPLLPGAYVEVLIAGKILPGALAVPRETIHAGNCVWLVRDGKLSIQPLEIVWTDGEYAYVTSGLPDEVLIVTSALDGVVDGMAVRTSDDVGGEPSAERVSR